MFLRAVGMGISVKECEGFMLLAGRKIHGNFPPERTILTPHVRHADAAAKLAKNYGYENGAGAKESRPTFPRLPGLTLTRPPRLRKRFRGTLRCPASGMMTESVNAVRWIAPRDLARARRQPKRSRQTAGTCSGRLLPDPSDASSLNQRQGVSSQSGEGYANSNWTDCRV